VSIAATETQTRTGITKNFYTLFMRPAANGLGIGEVVERTGIAEATLRMWERRYGFPTPERLASGHRRYSEQEVELIRAVGAKRAAGLALPVAIDQARREGSRPEMSVYAALRRQRPDVEPRVLAKAMMLALSHAIEDEALARAERLMVFGSFQRERFFRQAEPRWRELARTAELAVVFADFGRMRTPRGAPVEVPLPREHAMNREWALVCEGQDFALCMTGWERPRGEQGLDRMRRFEAIWSAEPEVVREAARICCAIAATKRPAIAEAAQARLEAPLAATGQSQVRLASAVTARMLSYASICLGGEAG
jgi:MerR family transcriptional regulator, light-induced transcriptional regulator